MADTNLSALIWAIAELLRNDFKAHDNGKIILPFTLLRRLDCVMAPTKQAVLDTFASVQALPETVQSVKLLKASGQTFYNPSKFDFNALRRSQSGSGQRCVWKKITLKIPRCKKCASIYRGISPQECTYPPFKELWDKGWKCGKEPSDDEMRKASGLKTRSEEALHKFLSYVAVYGGIGLIIWICSLCGC